MDLDKLIYKDFFEMKLLKSMENLKRVKSLRYLTQPILDTDASPWNDR